MAKLEELTALLVNEINDFRNGVEKLEKMNEYLKDTKIKMDLKEYKSIIEKHEQKMDSHTKAIERFAIRFDTKIKKAKIYPNWAVLVFVISLIISIVSTFFMFY